MSIKSKSPALKPLVSLSQLEFLLNMKREHLNKIAEVAMSHYKPFDLHKRGTSKWRHIDNPDYILKSIQKRILKNILETGLFLLPNGMTGGITGRSIIENAKIHAGKDCIGIIDIKDCFPNTTRLKIYKVWKDFFGCGKKTINILTQLTTLQDRLPQGAPTSPLLCNFSLLPIFEQIEIYAIKHNLSVSIFVDDIAVSGKKKDVTNAIGAIIRILEKNKYAVRRKKVKIMSSGFRQKLTGVIVNRKVSIGRAKINQIRNFIIQIARTKGYIPSDQNNSIFGKITFVKYLSMAQGKKLEKFAEELLIKPILHNERGSKDETRECREFNRNHKFIL